MKDFSIPFRDLGASLPNIKKNITLLERAIDERDGTIVSLVKENIRLRKENADTKEQLREIYEQYREYNGALFKRRGSGTFHHAVFCPTCHIPTIPFPSGNVFNCTWCGWKSSFLEGELNNIIEIMEKS